MRLNARELGDLNREWKNAKNSQKERKITNTAKKIQAKSKLWGWENQDRLEKVELQLERIGKSDKRLKTKLEAYKQSKCKEAKALLSFTHARQYPPTITWKQGRL